MPKQQTMLEHFWQENTSEDPAPKPITRYVKPPPRVSPIIVNRKQPAVDADNNGKTIKKFRITIRGEP